MYSAAGSYSYSTSFTSGVTGHINMISSVFGSGAVFPTNTAGVTYGQPDVTFASQVNLINADNITNTLSLGVTNAAAATTIQAGTGGLSLGNGGVANTIQVGNTTGFVAQTINLGNNTTASSQTNLTIGSLIGASATTIQAGTGGLSLGNGGAANTTIQVGNTTGAVAQTINLGNNTTASSQTNLTIGSLIGASATTIQAGTSATAIQLTQSTGGGIIIGGTGAGSTVTLQCGAGTTTCNLGSNATDHTTLVGGTTAVSATTIQAGTGGLSLGNSGVANTIQVGNTTGAVAQTINLGNNTTASSQTNLTIGSLIGASATTIQAGTSGVVIQSPGSTSAFQVVGTGSVNEQPSKTVTPAVFASFAGSYTVGYVFTPTVNGNITQLGLRNVSGTYTVTLYQCTAGGSSCTAGSSLASTAVTSTGVGNWVYANITSTPAVAGTYYAVAMYTAGGSYSYSTSFTSGVTGHINIINSVSAISNGFPTSPGGATTYGQPDVTFVVPQTNLINADNITNTLSLGVTNAAAATTIQAGTGGLNLGTGGVANTIQIGNTTGAVAQTINLGNNTTASSQTNLTIGSLIGASATTIQAGSGGVLVKPANSTTALQVQTANANTTLLVNTSANTVNVGSGLPAGGISSFTVVSQTPPAGQGGHSMASATLTGTKYVYLLPGNSNTVYYATQASDGTLGAWTAGPTLPVTRFGTMMTVDATNNYIYVIGGYASSTATTAAQNTIYYSALNTSTGAPGVWSTSANNLSTAVGLGAAFVNAGKLFVLGGATQVGGYSCAFTICLMPQSGTEVSTVQTSTLTTGAPGAFGTTTAMPQALANFGMATDGNTNVWVFGGLNSTNTAVSGFYNGTISAGTISGWSTIASGESNSGYGQTGAYANGYIYDTGSARFSNGTNWFSMAPVTGTAVVAGNYLYNIIGTSLQLGTSYSYAFLPTGATGLNVTGTQSNYGQFIQQTSTNSTTAFQVQNASGSAIFNVDTTNGLVGTPATNTASTASNSYNLQSGNATGTTSNSGNVSIDVGTATGTKGTVSIGSSNASGLTIGNTSETAATTIYGGSSGVIVQASSTSAFQVVGTGSVTEQPSKTVTAPIASSNVAAFTMGYVFTPTVNGNITQLGLRNVSGTYTVTLYQCTAGGSSCTAGSSLASTAVTSTGVGNWVYANITSTPAVAGTYYAVAMYTAAGSYSQSSSFASGVTGHINMISSVFGSGAAFPTTAGGTITYGQPDVTFASQANLINADSITNTLSLGVTNAAAATTIQAGTGGLSLGNGGVANTIQVGNTTAAVAQTINLGNNTTASSQTNLTIGSLIGASTTTIQAGTGGLTLGSTGTASLLSASALTVGTSANVAGLSSNITVQTGAASGGVGNTSGNINIITGAANTGLGTLTGNVLIDVGLASGGSLGNTQGKILIGTTNSSILTLGQLATGITTLQGGAVSVQSLGTFSVNKGSIFIDNASFSAFGSPATAVGANTGGTFSGAPGTTYFYKVVPYSGGGNDVPSAEVSFSSSNFTPVTAPTQAPTQTNLAGGNLSAGIYKYLVTYKTANGETTAASAQLTTAAFLAGRKVTLTISGITQSTGVTALNVYRTIAGGSTFFLLDNSTFANTCFAGGASLTYPVTSCIDNIPDASLSAINPPASNTATTNTNNITVSWTNGTNIPQYRVYRGTSSNGENVYFSTTTGTPFADTGAAGTSLAVPTNTTPTYGRLGIGTSAPTGDLTFGGTSDKVINVLAGATAGINLTMQAGSAGSGNNNGGNLFLQGGDKSGSGQAGAVIVKPQSDALSAFAVQTAAGANIFNVDTTNSKIGTIDTNAASTNSAVLTIKSGNGLGVTSNSGNVVIDVGTATGTAGTISIGTASTTGITIGRTGVITTIAGTLTLSGHILTTGTAPATFVAAAGLGTTGSCALSGAGTDTAGTISIAAAGTGQAAGLMCTMTFNSAFTNPHPVIAPTAANAAAIQAYVGTNGSTTMTVSFGVAPTAGQTYTFNYHTIQ
jgi:fibronectin-binding autotransporter adhesin